jgi:tetratricopeptide (TPR) repeat protein
MTWVLPLTFVVLACVAAAGVLRPFSRSRSGALDGLADPLEDERSSLLHALSELDDERTTGQLSEETYRALRRETEGRAVAVLRALDARDGAGHLASDVRGLRARQAGDGERVARAGPRARRVTLTAIAGAAVLAVIVLLLAGALRSRAPDEAITGTVQGGLAFFEGRVAQHPNDVAARLDLAQRYLESGDAQAAVRQYVAVLGIDPRNAEAHAQLGFILYQAGRPQDGLDAVQQALDVDPTYPEALYFKGVILLEGLDRPTEAAEALQAYLAAAPFGAHVDEARSLLQRAAQSG